MFSEAHRGACFAFPNKPWLLLQVPGGPLESHFLKDSQERGFPRGGRGLSGKGGALRRLEGEIGALGGGRAGGGL